MTYPQDVSNLDHKDLERAYYQLLDDRNFLFKRVDELMKKLSWIHRLMTNITLPPREKVVLYGLSCELKTTDQREDGFTHVYRARLANKYGVSESAAGDSMKLLSKEKVIEKKIEHKTSEKTGNLEKINLIAFGELVERNPKAIDFSTGKQRGGKREPNLCGCGCTERIVTRRVVCADCGCVLEETKKTLGENDELDLEPGEEVF